MNVAAHPLTTEAPDLSPWWLRSVLIVMVLGFAGLIVITSLAYRNAQPIPAQIIDAQVVPLFFGDEINEGQAIFLKYGLMNNGSVWGHGAYLGPDYSAESLHRIIEDSAILPGDLVFILFGALPLAIASIKGWLDVDLHRTS